MLITYCTIEDITTGLFQTQILDVVNEIIRQNKDLHIEVLVVNRLWHINNYLRSKKSIQLQINEKNIIIKYIPLLPPLRWALKSAIYSSFVSVWLRIIFKIYIQNSTKIIHIHNILT